jgi:restriction endonuclease S subunit
MNTTNVVDLIPLLRNDSDFDELEFMVRNRLISGIHLSSRDSVMHESVDRPSWLSFYKESKSAARWKPSRPISPEETYPLPRGWKWVRLNDLAVYINGSAFKPTDWNPTGTPIIRIQNLSNNLAPFNRTLKNFDPDYLVKRGDILVSWSATLDAYVWDRENAWLNQHIFRVLPNLEIVTSDYLYILLKAAIKDLSESSHKHGLTMKHINRGPFLDHVVPLPPLEHQSDICIRFSELQGEIRTLHKLQIAKNEEAFRVTNAVLANMYSSLINNDRVSAEKRLGEFISHISEQVSESASSSYLTTKLLRQIQRIVFSAMSESSREWKKGCVGDFLAFHYGKSMPKLARNGAGRVPVYGSNGVVGYHDEALVDKRCVVVGRKGSTGALQVSDQSSWVTDVAYYVLETEDITFDFLPFLLGTLDMEKMGRGVKPGLNRNEVYSLQVSIPPIHLQHELMATVNSIEELLTELSSQVDTLDGIRTRAVYSLINELKVNPPSAA